MPHPWNSLLSFLSEITSENQDLPIICPCCGNQYLHVRYGFYHRNQFDNGTIKIQRYLCNNDQCPRKTFSVLPHAFLRIIRPSLCMLMFVLKLYEADGNDIMSISRYTETTWSTIRSWLGKAQELREWITKEYRGKFPCLSVKTLWTAFNRDLSWTFYPARYR